MEIKTARRGPQGKESSVFDRLGAGRGGHLNNSSNKICKFWLSGRCLKNPCRFAHSEHLMWPPFTVPCNAYHPHDPHSSNALISSTWRRGRAPRNSQNVQEKRPELAESVSESSSECSIVENDSNLEHVVEEKPLEHVPKKTAERVCEFWVQWTCVYCDQCPYLHSWFRGDKFKRLAELQGHNKVWDRENWQCIMTLNGHDDVVKSLMCWDSYLFSGSLDCTTKVWASIEDGSMEVIYTHSEEHIHWQGQIICKTRSPDPSNRSWGPL